MSTSWTVRLAVGLPLGLFAGLVVTLLIGLGLKPDELPSVLVGKPAPTFALPDLNGSANGLTKQDLIGQVSILNVWASWCVPCRVEHPVLMDLKAATGARIFGLNQKDNPQNAGAFLAELGDPFDKIGADRDRRVSIDFGVYGVPETFIIDTSGHIRHKHIGQLTRKEVRETIIPLIQHLRAEAQ